jgi:hypothetical protein
MPSAIHKIVYLDSLWIIWSTPPSSPAPVMRGLFSIKPICHRHLCSQYGIFYQFLFCFENSKVGKMHVWVLGSNQCSLLTSNYKQESSLSTHTQTKPVAFLCCLVVHTPYTTLSKQNDRPNDDDDGQGVTVLLVVAAATHYWESNTCWTLLSSQNLRTFMLFLFIEEKLKFRGIIYLFIEKL